jgi:Family of unknown function (DUF6263)
MKHLFIIVAFAGLLIGCGDRKTQETTPSSEQKNKYAFDTSDFKTIHIKEINKNYNLSYNLEKNKTYNYRISTISSDHQKIMAPDTTINQTINQTSIYLAGLNLKNIDKDSILEVGCNISSIKLDVNSGPNAITYESGVTPDSLVKQRFAEYDALINNEFTVRVSKYGEISDIYRVDDILSKFLKTRGIADSVTVNEKDQLRQQMIEGILKPLVIQIFRQLPKKNVTVDSSWSFSQPPVRLMVFQSQNTATYKLTSLEKKDEDKLAVIEAGLIANITGDNKMTNKGMVYEFNKPKTHAEGKIYFNISKGLVQKSKTSTKINISFSMEMQTPKGKQKGNREEETTTTNIVELL